jgi:hypothetical protein
MRSLSSCGRQSRNAALEAGNGGMRRQAQDARAQHLLEAVHHRQHDDQHRDAETEPQMAMPAISDTKPRLRRCAQIAQSQEPFVPVRIIRIAALRRAGSFAACQAG